MPKHPLSAAIRSAIKDKGTSFANTAEQLQISPDSLRTWVVRNKYPEDELTRLVSHLRLGADLEQLRKKYSFDLTSVTKKTTARAKQHRIFEEAEGLLEAMDALDTRIEMAYKAQQDFGEDVLQLFRVMKKGDIFVYCSLDETPYEMQMGGYDKVKDAVRQAIRKEAHFIYLYPDNDLLKSVSSCGVRAPYPDEFKVIFERFTDQLKSSDSELKVNQHVHAHPVFCPVFMTTQHKYVLFRPAADPSRYRVFARFPTGNRGTDLALHVPLVASTSEQFSRFVRQAVNNNEVLKKLLN